jgi:hypothetical protein
LYLVFCISKTTGIKIASPARLLILDADREEVEDLHEDVLIVRRVKTGDFDNGMRQN